MNYSDAEKYLLSSEMNISCPGLDRIKLVLDRLGNPQNSLKIIHVVGTNGKGSVTSMLGSILECSGLKVGVFSSPFLNSLTEYIRVGKEHISKDDFGKYVGLLKDVLESEKLYLTHFEFITVISVLYFLDVNCDICIYEAGLGGSTDATNVFESAVCTVLTSVSIEHSAFLGNTLDEIIAHKAGIVHENECMISSDCIMPDLGSLVIGDIIRKYCVDNNIFLWKKEEYLKPEIISHSTEKTIFTYGELENVVINTGGLYQVENAVTVIETCRYLSTISGYSIDNNNILKGISEFNISCRFEKIHTAPEIIVDGGHNPECIGELVKSLETDVKYTIITGVMSDKDYSSMYSQLVPYATRFICIDNNLERALDSDILCREIEAFGVAAYNAGSSDVAASIIKSTCGASDRVLYVGTLYMAESFKKCITQVYDDVISARKYKETVERLSAKDFYSENYSLEDMKTVLKEFGSPQENLKCIHVAGTNGKGSTCSMIYTALKKIGYRTGLFTSPYIKVFNERIVLGGNNIENEMLVAISDRVLEVQKKHGIDLNQFALITCIAFIYFNLMDADYVVLETGLGGTYDPTNIVPKPLCTVITNIGLDHTAVLGDTIEQIANAKAGIIKENVPVICYPVCDEALKVISTKAKKMNSEFIPVKEEMVEVLSSDEEGTDFMFQGERYHTPLAGDFQAYNSAIAITVIKKIFGKEYVDSKKINVSFEEVRWPGRLEKVCDMPLCFVDGGHNPQCVSNVVNFFNSRYSDYKKLFIAGFMKDKDYSTMIKILADNSDDLYLVPVNFSRSLSISELSAEANHISADIKVAYSIHEAFSAARKEACETTKSVICVLGSLYQLKDIYTIIET